MNIFTKGLYFEINIKENNKFIERVVIATIKN